MQYICNISINVYIYTYTYIFVYIYIYIYLWDNPVIWTTYDHPELATY